MTCSEGPFELLTRPYPFKRNPFQLGSGELITYEGIYFSIPGSGLLLEKRLFTNKINHPIVSPVKLYINKDAGLSPVIEPDDDGAVYVSGTPHYADYILDLRALIDDVTSLHASDSDHTAQDFLDAHLSKVRSTYNLSGLGLSNRQYLHPEPVNTVPSGASPAGASGALPPPGDGHELGAQQIMDIDMDEIQWSPIARPKKLGVATPANLPIEPAFPMVLKNGSLPGFSSYDEQNFANLAVNAQGSGGIIITGDGLFLGTSIKLVSASGSIPDGEGSFVETVPWKQFPCQDELCTYYTPRQGSGSLNAEGRQAIYRASGILNDGVYALIVSDVTDISGQLAQHWPGNYYATSGIDNNGHAHNGIHITDRLIYDLNSVNGGICIGYSPINGKRVFGHWVGPEVGSAGETYSSSGPKYQNGDSVYMAGKITQVATPGFAGSRQNWATTNNQFAPVSWENLFTSALGPFPGIFGAPNGVTYLVADIQAGALRGVITRKVYAPWGFIDQLVIPDQDRAQGGQRREEVITYTTITYNEGTGPNGEFMWVQVGEPQISTSTIVFYDNTYHANNIFSFFFLRRPNNGFVHVNGDIYIQWGEIIFGSFVQPINNKFASIDTPTNKLYPEKTRTQVITSIGFFPSWKLVLTVTTNNQVSLPDTVNISPAASQVITFDPALGFNSSSVIEYGAPVWDEVAGINYLWFTARQGTSTKTFFAHMNTNFVIFRINQTNGDAILRSRVALLSI